MKKVSKTSARASAKKTATKPAVDKKAAVKPAVDKKIVAKQAVETPPVVVAEPVAEPVVAPAKPKRGLGRLGLKTLERPEIVPSLVLIPANKAPVAPPLVPSSLPSASVSASSSAPSPAVVSYLRDELRSLLALLDEAPPSL